MKPLPLRLNLFAAFSENILGIKSNAIFPLLTSLSNKGRTVSNAGIPDAEEKAPLVFSSKL